MFQVLLKDRKEFLDFNGMCTDINYKNDKMCIFEHVKDGNRKVLAVIPHENILYIRNYPYKED